MNFLTPEELEQHKVQHDIKASGDVPTNVIYRIENVKGITTQKGHTMVVSLVDVEGKQIKAFATSILEQDLADFNRGCTETFLLCDTSSPEVVAG